MSRPLNVLVLGVGGNVSQGILKALRLAKPRCRIVGACIHPLSMGLYTVDRAYVSPAAHDPAFGEWLLRTCVDEGVDAVLSGVEPVLEVLSLQAPDLRARTGAVAIVSPPDVLAIGSDKLATCEWLRDRGFAYPRFADAADSDAVAALGAERGYPLIAKPRIGKGSAGVSVASDSRDLDRFVGRSGYVIEEHLGDESVEFTVGCFSDRTGRVRGAIAMRRELLHGTTSRAVAGEFPDVRAEAVRIVETLKPVGPCNVQLRVHAGRPTCFEINVRFSGTTPMRARFGFNEVEAALRHFVLEEEFDLPHVTEGIAVRYWNELYVDPRAKATLEDLRPLDGPPAHASFVEDYGPKR